MAVILLLGSAPSLRVFGGVECEASGQGPPAPDANRFASRSEWGCAASFYDRALMLEPDSIELRVSLGKALLQLDSHEHAAIHLEIANRHQPDDAQTVVLLARALLGSGRSDRAVDTLAHFKENRDARIELGRILADLGRYQEAAQQFRLLLDSQPEDGSVQLALAGALIQSHATAEGVAILDAYSRAHSRPGELFEFAYLSGLAARQDGEYKLAVERLQLAVKRDPSHADARYQLGFALARLGKLDRALLHLREASALKAGSVEILHLLTSTLRRRGLREEATRQAAELTCVKQEQQCATLLAATSGRAAEALASGDAGAAAALYRQALKQDPHNAKTLYNLSLSLEAAQDSDGKRRALEAAVVADPGFAPAQHQLALVELASGKVLQAETRFKLAIEADPTMADAFNNLGVLYGQTDRLGLCGWALAQSSDHSAGILRSTSQSWTDVGRARQAGCGGALFAPRLGA